MTGQDRSYLAEQPKTVPLSLRSSVEDYTHGGNPMTEKALLRRIVIDPTIMLGKPVIRGTRLAVEIIVEKIGYGAAFEDIIKD